MASFKKFVQDGRVAVLFSPGYGAGWSTWNDPNLSDALCMDSRIVEAFLSSGPEAVLRVVEENYPEACTLGIDKLGVEWIPAGTRFRIEEYDGSETVMLFENERWMEA